MGKATSKSIELIRFYKQEKFCVVPSFSDSSDTEELLDSIIEMQCGELATLPLVECMETKTLSLVFQKDKYMPGYVRRFIDYLIDTCRDRELWLLDHN